MQILNQANCWSSQLLGLVRKIYFFIIVCSITVLSVALTSVSSGELVKSPMVEFTIIGDKKLAMADLRGHAVLVTFWATTCVTCIKEIPHLVKSYNKFNDKGLEIIAVAMPYDPPAQVWQMVQDRKLPYRVAVDVDGSVSRAFKPNGTPSTFIIAPNGDIVYSQEGLLDFKNVDRIIEAHLPRPGQKLSGRVS